MVDLLSWLFSQSRPDHPCPIFLFSYLRRKKKIQRHQQGVIAETQTQGRQPAGTDTHRSLPGQAPALPLATAILPLTPKASGA